MDRGPGYEKGVRELIRQEDDLKSKFSRFDGVYYQRFYHQGRNPVHTTAQVSHLAQAVDSLCAWWGVRVRSVLDIGAGPGYWRDWLVKNRPGVRVLSTDVSEYACQTYGHVKKDISKWRPGRPFDLVVCLSVLQYLNDRDAAAAIRNIGAATREVLYLEVPTLEDQGRVLDPEATDFEMSLRPAEWYQNRLRRHFVQAGSGLWISKKSRIILYELEGAPLPR
jgi:hypothetical protein